MSDKVELYLSIAQAKALRKVIQHVLEADSWRTASEAVLTGAETRSVQAADRRLLDELRVLTGRENCE